MQLLNLALLRGETPEAEAAAGVSLSRRRMMSIGGIAAFGMTPLVRAIGATIRSEFDVESSKGRVAFLVGGDERWAIDVERFGGAPRLEFDRQGDRITIALHDARYPGTDIPADFSCAVTRELGGWRIAMDHSLGHFRAEAPFVDWLIGAHALESTVEVDAALCRLADGTELLAHGVGAARMAPDWSIAIEGDRVASYAGLGAALGSDALRLSLLATESASVLTSAATKRTLVELERGVHEWMPELPARATAGWKFSMTSSPFDQLTIEAGEDRSGERAHAVVAEGVSETSAMALHPCAGFSGGDGTASGLPLRNARYAAAMAAGTIDTAIVARYGDEPVWLHTGGASLQLGDGEGVRPMEIVTSGGELASYHIEPATRATYIPVPGALAEPATMPATARTRFLLDGDRAAVRDASEVRIDNVRPDDPPIAMMLSNPFVPIIRHEDLVTITFEFPGMKIESRGSTRFVVASGTPYMVAHFPPQNIGEQAFYQAEQEAQSENPLSPSPYMPIFTRISGRSRLAFKFPSGQNTIELDAEKLLEAMNTWEPSVAPTAQPPQQVDDLGRRFDIDSLKGAKFSTGGKRLGVETYSKEWLSPLTTTAMSAAFTKRPKGMKRGVGETRMTDIIVGSGPGGGTRVRRSSSAVSKGIQLDAARSATTQIKTARQSYEEQYSIDMAEIEMAPPSTIEKIKAALPVFRPPLAEPKRNETAIESPYRIIISPNRHARWAHALTPVTHEHPVSAQPYTELWHTRLGVTPSAAMADTINVDEEARAYRTIRAIWLRTPNGFHENWKDIPHNYEQDKSGTFKTLDTTDNPFRMSIHEAQRHNLVHLSANFKITYTTNSGKTKQYEPLAVKVDRLMLTSLGSWMNFRGTWNPPIDGTSGLTVEEWRHRATMGRDHYVRIVEKGYLFPFGHRASLITITERRFHTAPSLGATKIAYLRQETFIAVREPEKNFRTTGLVRSGNFAVSGSSGESIDRKMPFGKVRIHTTMTPRLDPAGDHDILNEGTNIFWPYVSGKPFQFQLSAVDLDEKTVEFSMPLVFVIQGPSNDAAKLVNVRTAYDGADTPANGSLPTAAMFGQKVAFAESDKAGDTSYETEAMSWTAEIPSQSTTIPDDQPRFYPSLKRSKLSIPSIKHMAQNDAASEFKYNTDFLKLGFAEANKGKILLDLFNIAAPVGMSFDQKGEKSGGMVKPNMNIIGLSRALGPVSGAVDSVANFEKSLKNITDDTFDPEDFFKGLNAKLFGVIDLWTILQKLDLGKAPQFITEAMTPLVAIQNDLSALKGFVENPAVGSLGNNVINDITGILSALPNILDDKGASLKTSLATFRGHVVELKNALPTITFSDEAHNVKKSLERMLTDFTNELETIETWVNRLVDALNIPNELKITLEWGPELQDWPASKPLFKASNEGKPAALKLGAEMIAKTNFKSAPKFEIYCRLQNFSIDLIAPLDASFMILHFRKLEFYANSSMKSDIVCDFGGIEFVGPLAFIETIKEFIPLDGFSDPPAIDVGLEGITASFSLALPNIAFGVFAMTNMTLNAGFKLPFIGEPLSINFSFCTRENPFCMTISMIGGGGFFGITLNPAGVHILEASFEVGACLALDFGVASGSIYAFVGFYFKMEGDDASLTGYFRCGGEVDVLGIISVSIELYLSLTYEFSTGKCTGRATLTISIEILFFEITVEISCEKKFSGANGDPTFAEMMAPYQAPSLKSPGQMEQVRPWEEYVGAFAW